MGSHRHPTSDSEAPALSEEAGLSTPTIRTTTFSRFHIESSAFAKTWHGNEQKIENAGSLVAPSQMCLFSRNGDPRLRLSICALTTTTWLSQHAAQNHAPWHTSTNDEHDHNFQDHALCRTTADSIRTVITAHTLQLVPRLPLLVR